MVVRERERETFYGFWHYGGYSGRYAPLVWGGGGGGGEEVYEGSSGHAQSQQILLKL